jgi:hypothetical protein
MTTPPVSFRRALNVPLIRYAIGFFGGGIVAAVIAGLVFVLFFPLPPNPPPTDHTREALAVLVMVVFFCGGFIARRAFCADFLSYVGRSIIASYAAMLFICFTASLDFAETAGMIALATAGIIPSTIIFLFLGGRYPVESETLDF